MLRLRLTCLFGLLFVVFSARTAHSQSQATLTGAVSDPSGATIADAEITVQPLDTAAASPLTGRTAADGRFLFTLAAGRHRIHIAHRSFSPYEQTIALSAGETRELPVRLELERYSATVIVTGQAQPWTAETTPAPVQVITQQEIAERQSVSLASVLVTLPGAAIGRSGRIGGVTSLHIDGGNFNFTKVLVDGTPVNEAGGAVDFSSYTLENVAKVEVVHGAESALYGSDAVAGVVQIFTQRGTTRRPRLDLLAEGGSFSSARGSAAFSGLLGRLDYSAAAGRFDTQGDGPNNGFRNLTLSGNFGWRFSETNSLRLALRNNTSDAGIAGQTLITPPDLNQHNALHNFSSNLSWDFSTGSHWRHHLSGGESYIRQLFDNPLSDFFLSPDPFNFCTGMPRSPNAVPSNFCDFTFLVRNQFNRAGLYAQSSYVGRRESFTAGYEYQVENAWLTAIAGAHARRNNQAGYVDARFLFGRRLTVNAGARAEDNASFGTRVVPRAGLVYAARFGNDFWGATRLRFSYGQGIKEPRLDQSFGTDPCAPGNPGLRPEQSRTTHAGVDQNMAGDHLRVSLDYFYNRYRDIISFGSTMLPGCSFPGTYFNTDLARAQGVNLGLEAKPLPWLRVNARYGYDDSRVLRAPNAFDPTQFAGNRLLHRPVYSGSLILNASYRQWNANLAGYFSGRRTDSDFQGLGLTQNPGYAKFDFAVSYDLRRGVTAFGRAENLFDRHYQEIIGFPTLGRDFRVGMKFTIGGE
jgi:vitamin B12 transporter